MIRSHSSSRPHVAVGLWRRRALAAAVAGVALAGLVGTVAAQNRNANRSNQPATQAVNQRQPQAQPQGAAQAGQNRPHAGMLRFPDVSKDTIVFGYANDLWVVDKKGGVARPLASPPGGEQWPRFSPDGTKIAFVGNYEGDRDIYVIDVNGGIPQRLTYHPTNEVLNGWVGNDKVLYAAAGMANAPIARQTQQLYVQTLDGTGATGGLPEQLPVPWGSAAELSEDGKTLAYTPHSTDYRTWKRYRGGMATDIWLFNTDDKSAQQVTTWEGTDTAPMLHGGKLYYLSDENKANRLNLFRYDPQSKQRTQLTDFSDFDVRFPSMGPGDNGEGEVVFQQGSKLYTLSLANGAKPREVQVTIPGAKPTLRPRTLDAFAFASGGGVGPTGKQIVMEARGDVWTLPAETGHPVQLTSSDDAAERNPSWSPDGKWVIYSGDADGEYNIYLIPADKAAGTAGAEPQKLTDLKGSYWTSFEWAPDGKKFVAQDQTGTIRLVTLTAGDGGEGGGKMSAEVKELDKEPTGGNTPISWSHDSNWIAYHRGDDKAMTTAVYLYDTGKNEKHKVTSDMFAASFPTFDRKGEWLYYVTSMEFGSPEYSAADTSFVYRNVDRLAAVPLRKDVKNPRIKDLDKEKPREEKKEGDKPGEQSGDGSTRPATDEAREGRGGDRPRRGRPGAEESSVAPTFALTAEDFFAVQTQPATQPSTKPADEQSVSEQFNLESPVHGEWGGKLKGLRAMGAPEDEAAFTMTIFAHADGSFSGSSEAMGQTSEFDSITFDAGSGQFTGTGTQGPVSTTMSGKVTGENIAGTWEAKVNGAAMGSGTWEASKSGAIDAEKLAAKAGKAGGGAGAEAAKGPLTIDLDGFEARAMMLPVPRGDFRNLAVNDRNQLIYVRFGSGGGPGGGGGGGGGGEPPSIKLLDITEENIEEGTVIAGTGGFDISADGKKLLVTQFGAGGAPGGPPGAGGPRRAGPRLGVINAAKGQQLTKPVPTDGMTKRIDPRDEWKQIVKDAWRRQRDYFYVENMHGVDWEGVLDAYLPMVDDAVNRDDVSYIISEMISELNIGHAYYQGGDTGENEPSEGVGMLGCDFALGGEGEEKAYKISRILTGASYDLDARGPLSQPGIDVKVGDFLLAVNGQALDPALPPWAAFVGLAGRPATLTVSDKPAFDAENKGQRNVVVTPIGSDADLRYRDWIAANARYVDEASSGRVGYIYVPNTGVDGQNDLFRQFYGQRHKDALIIDERWNGGGQIPTRFIELLDRPRQNMWALRYGRDWHWPPDGHTGPKAMLINGLAGSGGDMFPWLFKQAGLGKLIGTRTWGGLVGISGVPSLIDGGSVTVPNFGFYELDGTWGIEGHGVDPDIEVIADPSKMQNGKDVQIDAAVAHLMEELKKTPPQDPKRPADPDRKGMGLPESDR